MRAILSFMAALAVLMSISQASAAEHEVENRPELVFAEHDGIKLVGDLYLPKGRAKAPVLVAVHGGGWQVGSRQLNRIAGTGEEQAPIAVKLPAADLPAAAMDRHQDRRFGAAFG